MSMKLHFTKMHGLGNDFVVINAVANPIEFNTEQLRLLANRHLGIGCDQVLLVEASHMPDVVDFNYRIFNADGSEVEQCGNGARCFAQFVYEEGLTDKQELVVQTQSGIIRLYREEGNQIRVNMGVPQFNPDDIPFLAEQEHPYYSLQVAQETLTIGAVSMGNPHAVHSVLNVDKAPVEVLGALIESHPRFPERVNAGFMQILNRQHIRLRVYERGSGETQACGTGACAAMVIGRRWGDLDSSVDVELPGGHLTITWDKPDDPVWMTGPAVRVFEGQINL